MLQSWQRSRYCQQQISSASMTIFIVGHARERLHDRHTDLSALVLLDLSAAFDTVYHDILIRRLKTSYGLSGVVLQWFQTYLIGRRQYVRTGSSASSPTLIVCGVPLVGSRPNSFPAVHCRPDFVDPGSLPTSLRRRRTDIWFLSSVCVTGAAEHHHQLCR